MKLILIRHGESARNRGYEVSDEENNLTASGVKQVVELGETLLNTKIDVIYCSDTPRCIQTLDEILRKRQDDPKINLTSLIGPKMTNENYEKLKSRVALFVDDLKYDHEEAETVVAITHLAVIRMINFLVNKKDKLLGNAEVLELEIGTAKI